MADEGDLGPQGSANGSARQPELTVLEERIARIELDLAALHSELSARSVSEGAAWSTSAAWTAAPPAPPPVPVVDPSILIGKRVGSRAWVPAPHGTASAPDSRDSFESRLGSQIFNRIGIVLLLSGTAYFLKLAIDRQWIGPNGRVIAGLAAGAALVVWSERFRHKGFAAFSYSLKALGSGVLYLSLWAAFQLFHLLPAPAALGLMLLVTAWNAYMAWAQDSELLAVYATAGGFATPMLLATGGNHEIFLFTYLLAIDVAIVALVRLKMWPRLLLGAFPVTMAFFIGWYVEFYAPSELVTTCIFIVLFGVAFASVPLGRAVVGSQPVATQFASRIILLEDILLPLANAAFVALAFYSALQDSGYHDLLPWMMIVLSTVYLGLMRVPQTQTASAIHLSVAVVFLTIAIPLKASGHWITVSWLVEGLALLWVAARMGTDEDALYAMRTLRWLGVASLALGFAGVFVHLLGTAQKFHVPFLNQGTGTALTGVAVFAAAAWLALRAGRSDAKMARDEVWYRIAMGAVLLIATTAALLTMRELGTSWFTEYSSNLHLAFRSGDFFTALMALAVFAGVVAASLRFAGERSDEPFWMQCAALSTIAFNLIAVLTGVREIEAIWGSSAVTADGVLRQALAISAFLMVYGAALLAAGFWRRSGFLRWQALVLLVFTIFKTFLYDMRNLSQGYRVVSFLGLGALLMAISFAYQKDWLNLREPEKQPSIGTDPKPDSGVAR